MHPTAMYPHCLMIPCLGIELANHFWDWYPDEMREWGGTTQYVGKSRMDVWEGRPLFLWSMGILLPSNKGIFSKNKKSYAEAFVRCPIEGLLIGVQDFETMFSDDKTTEQLAETDGQDVHEDHLQNMCAFILTKNEKRIPAIKPYEDLFEIMDKISDNGDANLGPLVKNERRRLSKFLCPTVDSRALLSIIRQKINIV